MWPSFDLSVVVVPFGFIARADCGCLLWSLYGSTILGSSGEILATRSGARYAGVKRDASWRDDGSVRRARGLGGASEIGDFRHVLDPRGLQAGALVTPGSLSPPSPGTTLSPSSFVALLLGGLANAGYSLQALDSRPAWLGVLRG